MIAATNERELRQVAMKGMLAKLARDTQRRGPAVSAAQSSFLDWVEAGGFIADREPVDLRHKWRYLQPIYAAVPANPVDFDLTIMKPSQAGASIFSMLWTLWLMLRGYTGGYFLPVATTAMYFSQHRFLKLARENAAIHLLMGDQGGRKPGSRAVLDEGSASVRTIADGRAYFTYMGGKITTEALALDFLVLDEVQSMLLGDIQKVEERISSSALKARIRVSTANFVGADIHHFYERSSQHEWHTRCKCKSGVVLSDCWDPVTGPLCIDRGNGTTPSVPTVPFYVCPQCRTIITDPQDGRFIAHAAVRDRLGYHWSQMLSPMQTPASILAKWQSRVDTAHFYRRVLGMPYTDPDTQPVSEAMCIAAQNPDLRWGPPAQHEVDGVFMGLDQMGHDVRAVIAARVGDKLRLLHIETIQADDPWRRTAELMRLYHVRFCAVEALPNFNEAHRFAKAHEKRVFVVYYQDHLDEVITWGDRPREKVTTRRTDDDFKTRYTASADQYKLMSLALSLWSRGVVETPDARTLVQRLRTADGERLVQVCCDPKLGLWLHMQRVALVTELPAGREDERKPRRAVKKIGIDPHYAYAWMLLTAAFARAYGTAMMIGGGPEMTHDERVIAMAADRGHKPGADPYIAQVVDAMPEKFDRRTPDPDKLLCRDCANFKPGKNYCQAREFFVAPTMPVGDCPVFVPASEEDVEWN